MSATSGVNVLRYSALAFGVFYGFSHQRSINAANRAVAEKREYEHKQQLITKAKEEFARKKNPAPSSSGGREYTHTMDPGPVSFSEGSGLGQEQFLDDGAQQLMAETVNQDPMDPNFDLEAFFNALVKENP